MLTIGKRRIGALVLMVAVMATMFIGYASASTASTTATSTSTYSFWVEAPGGGGTDTATLREKVSSTNNAYYNLTTITNNTGKEAYINVRSSDKITKAGTAATIYSYKTSGVYKVYYLTGYGNVGSKYCPSAQSSTSSNSTTKVYISGTWRP